MNWNSRAYIDQLQLLGPSSHSSQKDIERNAGARGSPRNKEVKYK